MTTTTAQPFVLLAHCQSGTETFKALHRPHRHLTGHRFSVEIEGGPYHGARIRCATHDSAIKLFQHIVTLRHRGQSIDWMLTSE